MTNKDRAEMERMLNRGIWRGRRCEYCGLPRYDHVDETKCLFMETDFYNITDAFHEHEPR